ncbi:MULTISPECIES: ABC transporter ATP-binding protein [unclassified Sporosarcina]|uniref:ABC transporter ATP-binding protein n=1 Tax=unclassified Sporosarcina TaxID=2647733 RepID=UPI0020418F7C|nr:MULTISPECIES: ABC transporter ATP-binding protein [unclassified Sporosarcina]GKV65105.1 ABC transporter ATP-binding protein [Sporosarcina sp. NCCP-2331]GLB55229.1 ABC transporter ATP-binding protein [Sporosarcina sp. NCCP-2378]
MSEILLKNINKYFGKSHVLKDVNLKIEEGEFMTLLGPSGCGKTTTLRIIAGLENPEEGLIGIGDKEVVNAGKEHYLPPAKRDLNLVFQSYALWPHMTVFENVSFGLSVKKFNKKKIQQKVEDALERMQIKHLKDRSPSELSGGQQQRVAIARAIVTEPKILLLDEPLSNLDAKLRVEMRAELKRLHHELKTTIVYVTHDQLEALTLSTRIAVFFDGELIQVDTPQKLYHQPNDLRVAEFIGNPSINLISGTVATKGVCRKLHTSLGTLSFTSKAGFPEQVTMALKPEDVFIHQKPSENSVAGVIYSVLPAGAETFIQIKVDGELLLAKVIGDVDFPMNTQVWITFSLKNLNVYDRTNNQRLPIDDAIFVKNHISLKAN